MTIEDLLSEIQMLANRMRSASASDRSNDYYKATSILRRLADLNRQQYHDDGYVNEKLAGLKWHLASLAELDEGNRHDTEQHFVWVLGELDDIRMQVQHADRQRKVK